ncbi:hypothetical protein LTR93_011947, partial [Exophiala xenobiotica]
MDYDCFKNHTAGASTNHVVTVPKGHVHCTPYAPTTHAEEGSWPFRSVIWAHRDLAVKHVSIPLLDITAVLTELNNWVSLAFSVYVPYRQEEMEDCLALSSASERRSRTCDGNDTSAPSKSSSRETATGTVNLGEATAQKDAAWVADHKTRVPPGSAMLSMLRTTGNPTGLKFTCEDIWIYFRPFISLVLGDGCHLEFGIDVND